MTADRANRVAWSFARTLADALSCGATAAELSQLVEEEIKARVQDRIAELRDLIEGTR